MTDQQIVGQFETTDGDIKITRLPVGRAAGLLWLTFILQSDSSDLLHARGSDIIGFTSGGERLSRESSSDTSSENLAIYQVALSPQRLPIVVTYFSEQKDVAMREELSARVD